MAERISVALATYNGAEFLEEQLASVAAQTRLPDELVVTDDGSHDDTLAIAERFATAAPFPVKIHRSEERLGYRGNFRRAVRLCSGSLIAFCDQDDVWSPDKLASIVPRFADPALMMVYHNAIVTDRTGSSLRTLLSPTEEAAALAVKPLHPFHFTPGLLQVFRAELCRYDQLWDASVDHNEPDQIMAHDKWFVFLALILGRVEFLDEPLLDYRQHGTNTYGAAPRHSGWARLQERLVHHGHRDFGKASAAQSRADIARVIAAREQGDKLNRVADNFEAFAQRLTRRGETYCRQSIVRRSAALISSISHRDYGSLPWKFDSRSIVRDLWSGVVKGTA